MKLPKFLKKYFWEVDFNRLDLKKRPEYVALRLLEYGDIKALRWLFRNLHKNKIRNILLNQRGLSPRSLYFWSSFFNVSKEKILCLKKSYLKRRRSHWPY